MWPATQKADEFGVVGVVEDRLFPTTPSRRLGLAGSVPPPPPESTIPAMTTTKSDSSRSKIKPKDDDDTTNPHAPSPDIASILLRTPRSSLAKSVNGKPALFS